MSQSASAYAEYGPRSDCVGSKSTLRCIAQNDHFEKAMLKQDHAVRSANDSASPIFTVTLRVYIAYPYASQGRFHHCAGFNFHITHLNASAMIVLSHIVPTLLAALPANHTMSSTSSYGSPLQWRPPCVLHHLLRLLPLVAG